MKKHALTLMALTLTAALLAGCSEKANTPNPVQSGDSSTTQSTSTTTESTESTESTTESTISELTSEPETRERFVYGETEIPDIALSTGEYNGSHIGVKFDGRININGHGKKRYDDRLLESMVFETHTFGDYTIRLVGDDVRIDKENFPGMIYTKDLRVEVEKNGKILSRIGDESKYSAAYFSMYPVGDFYSEELLFEDQIGNYLDIYDIKSPVIAMRYFNYTDVDEPFRKIVQFAWIEDNKVFGHLLGNFAENTGTATGGCEIQFATNDSDNSYTVYAIFSVDEFKVENENTLIDETAGIRYTFDFDKTDDSGHYFSTEKIK